jgi:hypothetical protein
MRVWNRVDQEEKECQNQDDDTNTTKSGASSSMAEINQLKLQLFQSREINRKLQEFCTNTLFNNSSKSNNSNAINPQNHQLSFQQKIIDLTRVDTMTAVAEPQKKKSKR